MKPQDVLVLLKLAVTKDKQAVSVRSLEPALGLSKSSINESMRRLEREGLVRRERGAPRRIHVNRLEAREFLQYGVRWLAPAKPGQFVLGIPTAHSAPPLNSKLVGGEPFVLPFPEGPVRGRAVPPIHKAAPAAAAKDPDLHRLLALVDAFRVGDARERGVAREELRACL